MSSITSSEKSKDPQFVLENTTVKLEQFQDHVNKNPATISKGEVEEVLSALQEANTFLTESTSFKGLKPKTINNKTMDRIIKAAQFFQFVQIDKPTQEKIGAFIGSLFVDIREESKKLNQNLKNAPHLERGKKAAKIDEMGPE